MPFVVDQVCRSCRHLLLPDDTSRRCGSYISDEESSSIIPQICRETCWKDACDKRLYRYDSVLVTQPIVERSYWITSSVPDRHRIPVSAASNITSFLLDDKRVFPNAEYLFDYNPSIIRLSTDQAHRLGVSSNGQYLASFRVSNQQSCMRPEERKRLTGIDHSPVKPKSKDYLGLAVLNGQFEVIVDATVDLADAGFPGAQDYRLFELQGKTYITSNDLIAELTLTIGDETIPEAKPASAVFTDRPSTFHVWVGSNPACAPCGNSRTYCGKNFNYFATEQEVLTEIWPSGPHTVRPIALHEPCKRHTVGQTYVDNPKDLMPSFATTEEVDFPLLAPNQNIFTNRGRGSACCVPIIHNGQTVLLGIQHRKTPSQRNAQLPEALVNNHYVSSFYAFEAKPPFRQIAESGHFCLGFGTAELTKLTLFRTLNIGRTFDCPRIHFVSGILKDSDDSIIVSYGINDCVSRFVRIHLGDVQRLLFNGPLS
jgi:hypothetical protein